jgi:hypothetical protein
MTHKTGWTKAVRGGAAADFEHMEILMRVGLQFKERKRKEEASTTNELGVF